LIAAGSAGCLFSIPHIQPRERDQSYSRGSATGHSRYSRVWHTGTYMELGKGISM